ncbi:MAG TPA: NAD-dependent epimerase/dehydratase family protein [Longimicrobiales bacterium]|nr:NAD-dependent epimerase/dehydratase family protein [Longimicrobiales bacterium]
MSRARQWGRSGARRLRIVTESQNRAPTLITGGAGFVGANLANRLLAAGEPVLILDNLARAGVERNLAWLRTAYSDGLEIVLADVRDFEPVARAVARSSRVFHFAAQVAVTRSLDDPTSDFAVNAIGTLNVLEAARSLPEPPPIVFTSTNKVYGALPDLELVPQGNRYEPVDERVRQNGVSENRQLDFHSPYGCSKGTADQYVIDYARTFGLVTVVLRMSCIYGPRQFGTEDQGWLAHFMLRALEEEPITIFGNGLQVRDALYIDDLVDALLLADRYRDRLSGAAYNIGGGPANSVSLLEVVEAIGRIHGREPEIRAGEWRAADQRYYVSDLSRFRSMTGWSPRMHIAEGLRRLHAWLVQGREQRAHGLPTAHGIA